MQAAGVLLFKVSDQSVEGERADERIKVLGLASGDEAIQARLDPATQEGVAGTQVRVETLRRNNKSGVPKHTWSAAVLDQASCLVSLLSVDDPLRRPPVPISEGVDVQLPNATTLEIRNRRFLFNTDLKPGHPITFETTSPVVVEGMTVIPVGSLVVATVEELSDSKSFGRGAKGRLVFKYLALQDGTRLPLRADMDLKGNSKAAEVATVATVTALATTAAVMLGGGGPLPGGLGISGLGFAVPAGTSMNVQLDGDQKFRVSRMASVGPDKK
jgi:hypothetical protein